MKNDKTPVFSQLNLVLFQSCHTCPQKQRVWKIINKSKTPVSSDLKSCFVSESSDFSDFSGKDLDVWAKPANTKKTIKSVSQIIRFVYLTENDFSCENTGVLGPWLQNTCVFRVKRTKKGCPNSTFCPPHGVP